MTQDLPPRSYSTTNRLDTAKKRQLMTMRRRNDWFMAKEEVKTGRAREEREGSVGVNSLGRNQGARGKRSRDYRETSVGVSSLASGSSEVPVFNVDNSSVADSVVTNQTEQAAPTAAPLSSQSPANTHTSQHQQSQSREVSVVVEPDQVDKPVVNTMPGSPHSIGAAAKSDSSYDDSYATSPQVRVNPGASAPVPTKRHVSYFIVDTVYGNPAVAKESLVC